MFAEYAETLNDDINFYGAALRDIVSTPVTDSATEFIFDTGESARVAALDDV